MRNLNQFAMKHRLKAGSEDAIPACTSPMPARPRPFRRTSAHGLVAHNAPAGMGGEPVDRLAPGHAVHPRQYFKGASA